MHHLLDEHEALRGLPLDAVWLRVRHHVLHGEEGQRRKAAFARTDQSIALPVLLDLMREIWADARTGLPSRGGYQDRLEERGKSDADGWLIDQFLTWCQHAAWLARFLPRQDRTP